MMYNDRKFLALVALMAFSGIYPMTCMAMQKQPTNRLGMIPEERFESSSDLSEIQSTGDPLNDSAEDEDLDGIIHQVSQKKKPQEKQEKQDEENLLDGLAERDIDLKDPLLDKIKWSEEDKKLLNKGKNMGGSVNNQPQMLMKEKFQMQEEPQMLMKKEPQIQEKPQMQEKLQMQEKPAEHKNLKFNKKEQALLNKIFETDKIKSNKSGNSVSDIVNQIIKTNKIENAQFDRLAPLIVTHLSSLKKIKNEMDKAKKQDDINVIKKIVQFFDTKNINYPLKTKIKELLGDKK